MAHSKENIKLADLAGASKNTAPFPAPQSPAPKAAAPMSGAPQAADSASAAPKPAVPTAAPASPSKPLQAAQSAHSPVAAPIQRPVNAPAQTDQSRQPMASDPSTPPRPQPKNPAQPDHPRLAAGPARRKPSLSGAKPSIGGLIYALDAKPSNKPYQSATIFSVIWFFIGGLLGWVAVGQSIGDFAAISSVAYTPAAFIIAACILIPIAMAWMMATLAVRAQEMKLMASAMTEVAIRLAEPDKMAEQKVASVGQTIRRQVSSMDDAISQSIHRAGELETMVNSEVAALERSYDRNETMMKGLIADLAQERQSLLDHGQEVVAAIGQVGTLVDQKLLKSSGDVAQSLARKSAEAAHKLHQANEVVSSKLETINQQVTDNIPAMMDKLVSEQARLDKVVVSADTSLKNLHGNLANQTNLLAKQSVVLTTQSDTLKVKTDELGKSLKEQTDRMDQVIDTHSQKMNKNLTQRVLALDTSLSQRAKAIDLTLDNRSKLLSAALDQKASKIDQSIADKTQMLDAVLGQKAENIDSSMTAQTTKLVSALETKSAQMDAALDQKTIILNDKLGERATALDQAMGEKARHMDMAIGQRLVEMNQKLDHSTRKMSDSISDHVSTLDQSLSEKAVAMDAAFSQKARALDASLENKARTIDKSLTQRISQIDTSMADQANAMSATLGLQTSKMKRTLDEHSSTIENSLLAQTDLLDKTLSMNNQSIIDTTEQVSMSALTAAQDAKQKRQEEEQHQRQLTLAIEQQRQEAEEQQRRQAQAIEQQRQEAEEQQRQQSAALQQQRQEAEELQRRQAQAMEQQRRDTEEQQRQQSAALQQQHQKDAEQAERLQQSSSQLMSKIQDLTHAFESQGIALLDEAKNLEAAIVQGNVKNSGRNLRQLSDKTAQLDQTKEQFSQQMQQALAQTQKEVNAVKQNCSSDTSLSGQQKLQEISTLEQTAQRQTERAMTKLQDNYILISQQVGISVDNANQYQAQSSQSVSRSSSFGRSKTQGSSSSAGKKDGKSSWSMGDLLSSSMNKDPDTPTFKPASSSQGAASGSVSMDPLDVLRIDEIARAIDAPTATNAWLRYQNGEKNVFTRNLYNSGGQLTFDRIQGRYQTDMSFRDTVERYVQDYEALLSESEQSDPSGKTTSAYLTTETGRVYLMLAHISGRLG